MFTCSSVLNPIYLFIYLSLFFSFFFITSLTWYQNGWFWLCLDTTPGYLKILRPEASGHLPTKTVSGHTLPTRSPGILAIQKAMTWYHVTWCQRLKGWFPDLCHSASSRLLQIFSCNSTSIHSLLDIELYSDQYIMSIAFQVVLLLLGANLYYSTSHLWNK